MNATVELLVISAAVACAAFFVLRRVLKALRDGRPSCCSDTAETGRKAAGTSCADADYKAPDGRPSPRPSYCAGCTGCGPRG